MIPKNRKPTHPGEILLEEFLKPMGLSQLELARRMGYVAQRDGQGARLTVFDAVLMGRRPHIGWAAGAKDLEVVEEVIGELNLGHLALRHLDELSGGELQKVMIARALAQEPGILLLDEPTAHLDAAARAEWLVLLRRLKAEGKTLVFCTHQFPEVRALADRVIAPALAVVGHDWENGKIDIWQEHRGTQLCAGALFELRKDLELRAEKNRPVAVGAAPAGDPYLLPTLLAQYVLLDAGWEAVNLGPNTPLGSLEQAVRQLRPRLLWLSVSYLEDEASFLHAYQALYRVAEGEGIAVAVGGRALAPALRSDMPYTTYGDRLEHLAAFARTLHPRPKRPKWGRPRRM